MGLGLHRRTVAQPESWAGYMIWVWGWDSFFIAVVLYCFGWEDVPSIARRFCGPWVIYAAAFLFLKFWAVGLVGWWGVSIRDEVVV